MTMENQNNQQAIRTEGEVYPFAKQPLNYPYNGLEPFIDTKTMMIHHDKHYGAYVDNLNKYIETKPALQGLTLEELITKHSNDIQIRHNAGGVYNHQFFFNGMRPGISQIVIGLSGKLLQGIQRDFGSVDKMKEQFFNTALSVFGSGYAWLCAFPNGKLCIVSTPNQDTPLTVNLKPLMCIDVWEHAYYLKHQNERNKYIQDFWHLVDWVKVSERLG